MVQTPPPGCRGRPRLRRRPPDGEVIARGPSTIRDADRIAVLEGGERSEWGCHADLLAAEGTYTNLRQSQADATTTSAGDD